MKHNQIGKSAMNTSAKQILLLTFSFFLLSGCVTFPKGESFNSDAFLLSEGEQPRVVVYNDSAFGGGYAWVVNDGNTNLGIVSSHSYLEWNSEIGEQLLYADLRNKKIHFSTSLTGLAFEALQATEAHKINNEIKFVPLGKVNFEQGKTNFYKLKFKFGGLNTPVPYLEEVDTNTALKELPETEKALL